MMGVFLVLTFIYCLLLLLAIGKWRAMYSNKDEIHGKGKHLCISVLIPARNESLRISGLLMSLAAQRYPIQSYEVVLIDDHSEDDTIAVAQELAIALSLPLRCIRLSESKNGMVLKGKKAALQQGVEAARGEVIVTTDADCVMGGDWLQSIHHYFKEHAAAMVVGPVTFSESSRPFDKLQTIELGALVGTGAVSLGYGKPNMCNGANLAFTKSAFEAVGGYHDNMHIPSGDDEFLLQKIYKFYPRKVYFNVHPEGVVSTAPAKNIKAFISQRRRWGGKWRLHKAISVKLMAVFVFAFHLFYLTTLANTLLGALNPILFIGVFIVKASLEYFFLKGVLTHMGKSLYMKHFVFLQTIYSLYVVVFGLLVNFGTFEWKGREYGKND